MSVRAGPFPARHAWGRGWHHSRSNLREEGRSGPRHRMALAESGVIESAPTIDPFQVAYRGRVVGSSSVGRGGQEVARPTEADPHRRPVDDASAQHGADDAQPRPTAPPAHVGNFRQRNGVATTSGRRSAVRAACRRHRVIGRTLPTRVQRRSRAGHSSRQRGSNIPNDAEGDAEPFHPALDDFLGRRARDGVGGPEGWNTTPPAGSDAERPPAGPKSEG